LTVSIVSDAPMPHRNAEKGADQEKGRQIGREGGGETQHRIERDVEHQDRAAAEPIREPSEDEGADRT
jgi:hypothetical protein